jgi:hypothetical protein
MTIAVTNQTLYDGPRRAKIQLTGISDGSGEVTLGTLVNAKALSNLGSAAQPCKRVKVERITGNTSYGNVELFWEAEVPLKFAELAGSTINVDYRNITAIAAPPLLGGATGNILYSTVGFSAGSSFMLEFEFIKAM